MKILQTLARIPKQLLPRSPPSYSVASIQSNVLQDFSISKEDLKTAYLSHPIVNRAIHFRADLIIARGFSLEFSDPYTKQIILEFLHDLKLNSPLNFDLKAIIRNACIDCDVFGNAFHQLIPNKSRSKIVALAPLHPLDMDYQRDSSGSILFSQSGEPLGYVFRAGSPEERTFERHEIAHLIFETIGDELLGIPLLLPMFRTLERLANIEFAIAQALYKHGFPTRDISVGDPDHPPTAEDIQQVADQVKNLDAASEYTHPYYFKVSSIDPKFPQNIQNIPEFFLSQIVAISGIPRRFLLGEEKFATTLPALQRNLKLMLEPLQARVKVWLEEQIFRRVLDTAKCDGSVTLTWSPILEQADPQLVRDTISLATTFSDGKPLISWEEARDRLSLPKSFMKSHQSTLATLRTLRELAGLYLVEPHGELIWLRRKKAIVKSVKFSSHIGEPLYLLSGKYCYGIITLDSPVEITLKEFRELAPKHLITEEERERWWPDKKKLFYYPFTFQKFISPRKWKYVPGVQNFVQHVQFLYSAATLAAAAAEAETEIESESELESEESSAGARSSSISLINVSP